jgi:hypothetical protein
MVFLSFIPLHKVSYKTNLWKVQRLATREMWPGVVLSLPLTLLSKPRWFALLAARINLFVLKIGVCDAVFVDWGLPPQAP